MPRTHTARRAIQWTLGSGAILAVALTGLWPVLQSTRPAEAADVQIIKAVVAPAAVSFADAKTGSIKGKVTFKGTVPELALLHKKGDPLVKDSPVCAAADMTNETLVVNTTEGNGIAHVCIYMQKAPEGYKAPAVPKETIDFDQKGCRFKPHTLVARVGQTILVKSGDSIAHNTHTAPIRANEFNQAIAPNERKGIQLVYNKAEKIPVAVRCDLHPFMKAYHCVQDHPFMAFTDEKGEFEIKDLPEGKHTFFVWQELAGYLDKTLTVTVTAGKEAKVELSYGPDKFKAK